MRRSVTFYIQCFSLAWRGNSAFANDWQWLVGVPALAATIQFFQPRVAGMPEMTWFGSPILDSVAAAFLAFIITWCASFLIRFCKAPPLLYYSMKDAHDVLVERYRPLLKLRFTPEDESIECVHHPIPGTTTYARVVASNASEEPVQNCRAFLERFEMQVDGQWVAQLQFSPVHLAWSGVHDQATEKHGAITMMPHGMRHPIDVIKAIIHQGRHYLLIENPGWAGDWIHAPGVYRLRILVMGDRCRPEEIFLCVDWNGQAGELKVWQDLGGPITAAKHGASEPG